MSLSNAAQKYLQTPEVVSQHINFLEKNIQDLQISSVKMPILSARYALNIWFTVH